MINQETIIKEMLGMIMTYPVQLGSSVDINTSYPILDNLSATVLLTAGDGTSICPFISICDSDRGIASICYNAVNDGYDVRHILTQHGFAHTHRFSNDVGTSADILNYISGLFGDGLNRDLDSFKSMISCLDGATSSNAENVPRTEVEFADGSTMYISNQYKRLGPGPNALLTYLVNGKRMGSISRREAAGVYRAVYFGEDSSVLDFTIDEIEEMFNFITKGPAGEETFNDPSEDSVEELLAKGFNVDGKATYTLKMIVREVAGSITEFDQKNIPVFGSLINIRNLASGIDPDVPTHLVETYRGGMDEFQFKMVKIKDKGNTVVATITPVPGDSIRVRTPYYDGTFKLSGFYAVPSKTISTIIFGK